MTEETGGRELLFLMTAAQAEAFERLVGAAERGDGGAACRLGDMYREGLGGLRYSPKETYRWYAKSALAGDPNGQNNLGACFEHGLGCAQSYAKAAKWYRLAAAQGLGTAAMNLGYHYLRGHGVPRDPAEALRLFREAVERGEDRAAAEVERLKCDLDVVESTGMSKGPHPASVAASPGGHAVDPSLEARSRLLPRDGPPGQLRHLHVAPIASTREASGREPPTLERPAGLSVVRAERGQQRSGAQHGRPRIRFVDETQPGRHFGLVGVTGVQPSRREDGDAGGNPSADGPGRHVDTEGEM